MTSPAVGADELQALCDQWLLKLELGEWRGRTRVLFKSKKFIEGIAGAGSFAACWWSAEECRCEIYMVRAKASASVLIHELLHLTLQGHTSYEKYDEMMERAINRIEKALAP